MNLDQFEALVSEAIGQLPQEFVDQLNNIDITVDMWASPEILKSLNLRSPYQLFGLYQGVPQTRRRNSFQLPDKITLFAGPMLARSQNETELKTQIQKTLKHEIAHHFGIGEDRLREKGY